MEIWKEVKGFEGFYEVSNLGNVRSCERVVSFGVQKRTVKSEIIYQNPKGGNYLTVNFSANNKQYRKYVHRLVAEAFIPNPENKAEVNHINEKHKDNRAENLEWVSRQENIVYSMGGSKNHSCKSKSYYEKYPIEKSGFKTICKRRGWNFEKFNIIFSGLRYKNGTKRYFFVEKG